MAWLLFQKAELLHIKGVVSGVKKFKNKFYRLRPDSCPEKDVIIESVIING